MRLLTKFWMQTPVGKLEFNRKNQHDWEMYPTKGGFEARYAKVDSVRITSRDVVTEFGWPTHFAPYGEIYEELDKIEEVKKIEPLITLHNAGQVWGTTVGKDTLIFASKEDLDKYVGQQGGK